MRALSQDRKNSRALSLAGLLILCIGGYFVGRAILHGRDNDTDNKEPAITTTDESYPSINPSVVQQKLLNRDTVVFVDVRDQASFDAEHIPQSLHTAPNALNTLTIDRSALIVVIASQQEPERMQSVGNMLKQLPFKAYILEGGIEGWKRGGNQVLSSGDPDSFLDQSKVTFVTPEEALKVLTETPNLYILDVQSPQNFQKRHIRGAVNIPLETLEKRAQEIPSTMTILVYGESELISFQAGVRLNDLSIYTALTLRGNSHLNQNSPFAIEP